MNDLERDLINSVSKESTSILSQAKPYCEKAHKNFNKWHHEDIKKFKQNNLNDITSGLLIEVNRIALECDDAERGLRYSSWIAENIESIKGIKEDILKEAIPLFKEAARLNKALRDLNEKVGEFSQKYNPCF